MGKSIDKLTNKQIDQLILKSTHRMNSLGIRIPYSFFSESMKSNWHDILIAIENDYLSLESAIDHALKEMEENPDYSNEVFNLALISPGDISEYEEIHKNLATLAELVSDDDRKKTKEKILFVLLKWIYENRASYEDPLWVVWIIYDDFGFPNALEKFVYYMSPLDPSLGFGEEKIKLMYDNWQDYLKECTSKFGGSITNSF